MRPFSLAPLLLLQAFWTVNVNGYYGIDYNAPASYFDFVNNGVDEYVFALSVTDNGDVYWHMSGPVAHCWIGVGFGSQMKDSFMIIAYPSADGLNTTLSPRIATGHTEPVFDPTTTIVKIYNDTYAPNANTITDEGTGTIISHAVCLNCSTWATGALDTHNTKQDFIFAIGPNITFRSDSPEASIPRHALVGSFTMDMTRATNYTGWYGRVPAPNVPHFIFPPNDTAFASAGSTPAYDIREFSNPRPGIHGALMVVAFVFIFPTGAAVMQFLKRALAHAALQVIGFCLVIGGFGVAVSFAGLYNKSKNYNSAHQVIGIIVVALLIIQLGLGLVHHAFYIKNKQPTPFGRIHFFLGFFIIILGLINGGLGLDFAYKNPLRIPYAIVVGIGGGIIVAALSIYLLCRRRKKYKPETDPKQYPPFVQQDDGEFEMREAESLAESQGELETPISYAEIEAPKAYEPTLPYTPGIRPPAPYSPTVPYTPVTAYAPTTPNTWRKEDITRWPTSPHERFF